MATNDANCTNVRTRAHHHKIDVFSLEFSIVPLGKVHELLGIDIDSYIFSAVKPGMIAGFLSETRDEDNE